MLLGVIACFFVFNSCSKGSKIEYDRDQLGLIFDVEPFAVAKIDDSASFETDSIPLELLIPVRKGYWKNLFRYSLLQGASTLRIDSVGLMYATFEDSSKSRYLQWYLFARQKGTGVDGSSSRILSIPLKYDQNSHLMLLPAKVPFTVTSYEFYEKHNSTCKSGTHFGISIEGEFLKARCNQHRNVEDRSIVVIHGMN